MNFNNNWYFWNEMKMEVSDEEEEEDAEFKIKDSTHSDEIKVTNLQRYYLHLKYFEVHRGTLNYSEVLWGTEKYSGRETSVIFSSLDCFCHFLLFKRLKS